MLVLAAVALALGAAAWISDSDQATALVSAALPRGPDRIAFDDRFPSVTESVADWKLRLARETLARRLMSRDWYTASVDPAGLDEGRTADNKADDGRAGQARPDETRSEETRTSPGIPLPRSRPVVADLESRPALADPAARPDDRTLLQKLSDLLPGNIKLASLTPEGGLFHHGPIWRRSAMTASLRSTTSRRTRFTCRTAQSLEAHSGMGSLKDDPEHVSMPNVGATPPAVYELKPRERLFPRRPALRMTPIEGSTTNGRSGLLAHSYMLGPDGDSNGCVSIRDYDRFLKAFNDGEINRLVVVPSLAGATQVAQRSKHAVMSDAADSETPLRTIFEIRLNGKNDFDFDRRPGLSVPDQSQFGRMDGVPLPARRRHPVASGRRRQCDADGAGDRCGARAVRPRQRCFDVGTLVAAGDRVHWNLQPATGVGTENLPIRVELAAGRMRQIANR